MPRLLAINNYYYDRGGSEAIFFAHNRMLEDMGWDIVPFSMQDPRNHPTPWSRYFIDDLEVHGAYSPLQKLSRLPKVIYSLEARRKLAALIDNARPDIAHGHNIYHHISPSILGLLKRRGIPTVLTLHDLKIACPAYNMLAPDGVCERCKGGKIHNVVINRCINGSAAMSFIIMLEAAVHNILGSYRRYVDAFIVPSRFYVDKFAEWGWPRSLFRYVPNFIDVAHYEPRYAAGERFVYFGRIIRQKGVATLIRAAAEAQTPLLIAGTGPDMEAMQALSAKLQADVVFAGHLRGQALHDVIRNARGIVLPSEWYENAPVSLLEAYALGKPVIGARIGGIPELVRENETGITYTSGDVGALVAALREFAGRDPGALAAMGRAGRRWVEQEFTLQTYRQKMMGVYGELGVNVTQSPTLALEASS